MPTSVEYNVPILLIDDDVVDQKKFARDLGPSKQIIKASNFEEAEKVLKKNSIEIVVCDLQLGNGVLGTDIMKKIKALYPDMNFILLTGYEDHDKLEESVNDIGIWQFLKKPWNPTNLVYVVNNLILHVQAENEKRKFQDELKASEERLNLAVDAAQAGIWDWDVKNNTIFFSDSWLKMLGYSDDEIENSPDTWQKIIHPEDQSNAISHLKSFLQKDDQVPEQEYRLKKKDGEWVHVLSRAKSLTNRRGKITRIIGSHLDLSDRYNAHIKIQQLNTELENRYEKRTKALKLLNQKLIHRNQFEHLISSISSTLISITSNNSDSKINLALEEINTFCGTESVFIVHFKRNKLVLKNAFTKRKQANLEAFNNIDISDKYMLTDLLFNEGSLVISNVNKIEKRYQEEKDLFALCNLESVLLIPIQIRNQKFGFLGMNIQKAQRSWNQEDIYLLKFIGEILANSYARIEDEVKLIERDRKLIEAYNTISTNEFNARILQSISSLANSPSSKKKVIEEILEVLSFYCKSIVSVVWQPKKSTTKKGLSPLIWESKSAGVLKSIKNHFKDEFSSPEVVEEWLKKDQNTVNTITIAFQKDHVFKSSFTEVAVPILVKKKLKYIYYFLCSPDREFDEDFISYLKEIQRQITFFVERDETKKELKKALNKEKELGDLKSQFISTASHQFRTPLTVIQSNVDLLHMLSENFDAKIQNKFGKISERVTSEVERLTNLMTDVLVLGKLNAKAQNLNLELHDLDQTCKELIQKLNTIQRDHRKMELVIKGQKQLLKFDKNLIEHSLTNLIENAFKYSMGAKSPRTEIDYRTKSVEIRIIDYGRGIPERDIKHLFQPFYRASNTEDIQGTGLGLTLCKEYIQMHKGRLRIKSENEKGTTFIIGLPYDANP